MPYASCVFVRVLVLLALLLSLGFMRDMTHDAYVAHDVPVEVSVVEVEPEAEESLVVDRAAQRAMPLHLHALTEFFSPPPCSGDAGGVFRPPRSSVG